MRTLITVLIALSAIAHPTLAWAWDEPALIGLAKSAIRAEVEGDPPAAVTKASPPRPVFVTIERKGRVIGCRGDLSCRTRSLESEIVLAARSAARHDPRYPPLTPKDLVDFQVTITIVDRLDHIDSVNTLPPGDGLVLKSGTRTGIVLPWEGKDPEIRLKWAYKKAGVPSGSPCQLYRLKAERFRG